MAIKFAKFWGRQMKIFANVATSLIAIYAISICEAAVAQVPPPPPSSTQGRLVERLIDAFHKKDIAEYADLLADDVRIYQDEKIIFSGKEKWLSNIKEKFNNSGVIYKIGPGYQSLNRILLIEYFNSSISWGKLEPSDCCWRYDAVSYDISDGLIKRIHILRGGDSRITRLRQ